MKRFSEDGFAEWCRRLGDAIQGHELRLHVGGEARMRRSVWMSTALVAAAEHVQLDASPPAVILAAGLAQLVQGTASSMRGSVRVTRTRPR